MTVRRPSNLRMDDASPDAAQSRLIASTVLQTRGIRLHLVLAQLITLALWVGCLYLTENIFAAAPWVALHERMPVLYTLLDVLFYTIDALVVVLLGLPLIYGCAEVVYAAHDGQRLPLATLFRPFTGGAAYGRAIAVMTVILLPRAIVFFLLQLLWHLTAATASPLISLALGALALILLALSTLAVGLDDALLPLALAYPEQRVLALYCRSVRLCAPRLRRIWCFKLTYLGWGVLSALSLGVLLFGHALPHYTLAHTAWTSRIYTLETDRPRASSI